MLGSMPVALQAVLWPLAAGALVVALNRLLPHWLGRLLALAGSLASVAALWAASIRGFGLSQGTWEPFTFLRANPALLPTPLGLLAGLALATWTAVAALGMRGSQHPRPTWYGLNLASLAGCLLLCLSANLLTLALGSALIDLALLAIAISAGGHMEHYQRACWRVCVPGLLSTGLLLAASLRQDAGSGSLSLLAQGFTPQVLGLLAAAGLLRLMVFPLHPRGLRTPEQASSLVLSMGAGIYLLSRTLALGPSPAGTPWLLAIGAVALLAGGWLAWTAGIGRRAPREWPDIWVALAANQAGVAVLFTLIFPGAAPWPLVGLIVALGLLAVWWDTTLEQGAETPSAWWEWIRETWQAVRERLRSWARRLRRKERADEGEAPPPSGIMGRLRRDFRARARGESRLPGRLRGSWLARRGSTLVPALALASLAGLPLTVGGVTRWHLYGALLAHNRPVLLVTLWAGDVLLAAGLWLAWEKVQQAGAPRLRPLVFLAVEILAVCSVTLGLVPRLLSAGTGFETLPRAGVSAWGLGLLCVLPWLLGAWLVRAAGPATGGLQRLRRYANLELASGAMGWLGKKLGTAVYWLGSVGEGEGWWGWVLIVVALGALYLAVR